MKDKNNQRKKEHDEAANTAILNLWLTSSCPYDERAKSKEKHERKK